MDETQALLQTEDPFGGLADFEIAPDLAAFIRYWWGGCLSYVPDGMGWYWEAA